MGSRSQTEASDPDDWWAKVTPDDREHLQRVFGENWKSAANAHALETLRKIREIESKALSRLKNRGSPSK